MINIENITINGTMYRRTYSDAGMMIEREGVLYAEAVDPLNSEREYTETDVPIEAEEKSPDEGLNE